MTSLKIIPLLLLASLCSASVIANDAIEEVVVTGSRIQDNAGPIVFTTKGDFLLQEVSLVNDSLKVDERKQDVLKTFENLLKKSKANKLINISRGESRLYPVDSKSDFDKLYSDYERKGSISVILKVNLKAKDKNTNLETIFEDFVESVNRVGRTQINMTDDERISIVDPRQYRKKLVSEIADDIEHITDSLGSEYRVILSGMDKDMSWRRNGEDNVEFSLPYSFEIIPETVNTIVSGYDD